MNGALTDECELTTAEEQRRGVLSSPMIYITVMALACFCISHLSAYSHTETQKVTTHAAMQRFILYP